MCGFTGFISSSNSFDSDYQYLMLKRMTNTLIHRGPDDSGFWMDPVNKIGLGHRRLAVLDLTETGHQPMISHSGNYVLIFNGEIYNHLSLRKELNSYKKSPTWKGSSDTETLLAGFEYWGVENTLNSCEGMFSFALWCRKTNVLFLGRDRLGEKPLYYGWQDNGRSRAFLFSSELKAFKEHDSFKARVDRDSLSHYMRYNCIPSPHSIYKGIYKLDPGKFLSVSLKNQNPKIQTYWSGLEVAFKGMSSNFQGSETEAINKLENLLKSTIKEQMISDVSLGAFLSGGVDSSTIVALMQSQSNERVKTFTVGFNEEDHNEAQYAKLVANHLGTDHTEVYVTSKDALEVIPSLPSVFDEPFSDSSQIPALLISKLARESVTVSLSGDGGDEIFGGYNRYLATQNLWRYLTFFPVLFRKFVSKGILKIPSKDWDKLGKLFQNFIGINNFGDKMHKGADVLAADSSDDLYLKLTSHWASPESLVLGSSKSSNLLQEYLNKLEGFNQINKMMVVDMLTYLPNDILTKVDRAAMSVSLETRVPFLNHKIIEFCSSLPLSLKLRKGTSKWILRQVLYKYVPSELIERPKAGFAVPINDWLKGSLRSWAEELLDENLMKQEGFFDVEQIRNKWVEHLSGRRNWGHHLWDVLMFQSWLRN